MATRRYRRAHQIDVHPTAVAALRGLIAGGIFPAVVYTEQFQGGDARLYVGTTDRPPPTRFSEEFSHLLNRAGWRDRAHRLPPDFVEDFHRYGPDTLRMEVREAFPAERRWAEEYQWWQRFVEMAKRGEIKK